MSPAQDRLSRKAKRAFETLGEELRRVGVLHYVLLYDPDADWNWQVHTFDDVGLLESVLGNALRHVRTGAHSRRRAAVSTEDEVRRAMDAALRGRGEDS